MHADLPALDSAARAWTHLGAELSPTRCRIVGRVGWVDANLRALDGAFQPLAARVKGQRVLASRVLGAQLGALLGLLSSKVLGQFVLPLSGPGSGQLLVVGPNLLELADEHGDEATDIRRIVLLHEITHRLQFDAVPWLGDELRGLLHEYLDAARLDPAALLEVAARLPKAVAEVAQSGSTQPLLEAVLTPDQVSIVARAQGLMSLLEGHGNATMYQAGHGLVRDPDGIRETLASRRSDVTTKVLTAVAGLELKQRQYAEGEAFVRAVVDARGVDGLNRVFEQPECLPSVDEIRAPTRWLDRVDAA